MKRKKHLIQFLALSCAAVFLILPLTACTPAAAIGETIVTTETPTTPEMIVTEAPTTEEVVTTLPIVEEITTEEKILLDWGTYEPKAWEIRHAESLPDMDILPRQIRLEILLLQVYLPSSFDMDDFTVRPIARAGDLYAVYVSGGFVAYYMKSEQIGRYLFKYTNSKTIEIYDGEKLIPLSHAYKQGIVDDDFLYEIYHSPYNTFRTFRQ